MNAVERGNYFTIEFTEDGIVCVRPHSVSRVAIDAWFAWIAERLKGWDASMPYLTLYDLTDSGVSYTSYMRAQGLRVNDMRPDVKGRIAIYMRRDANATLMSLLSRLRGNVARPFRVFYSKEGALAWLREGKSSSTTTS